MAYNNDEDHIARINALCDRANQEIGQEAMWDPICEAYAEAEDALDRLRAYRLLAKRLDEHAGLVKTTPTRGWPRGNPGLAEMYCRRAREYYRCALAMEKRS